MGYVGFFNGRRKAQVLFIILLLFITIASWPASMWMGWVGLFSTRLSISCNIACLQMTFNLFMVMMLLTDCMFLNDDDFNYDPDFKVSKW